VTTSATVTAADVGADSAVTPTTGVAEQSGVATSTAPTGWTADTHIRDLVSAGTASTAIACQEATVAACTAGADGRAFLSVNAAGRSARTAAADEERVTASTAVACDSDRSRE
jgi:hypothetical protein